MHPQRLTAVALSILVLSSSAALVASGKSETEYAGDVVVNGAFRDARPTGHPLKIYANDVMEFVAYDWLRTSGGPGTFDVTPDGLHMGRTGPGEVILHHYFNGSEAASRPMRFFGFEVTGRTAEAGATSTERVEVRWVNEAGAKIATGTQVAFTDASATTRVSAADLGLDTSVRKMLSVRIWHEGSADVVFERVSVYATNGLDARNVLLRPAGDDVVTPEGAAVIHDAGDDDAFSWEVTLADDAGNPLPAEDAVLCVYAGGGLASDEFAPGRSGCASALLDMAETAPHRRRVGDAVVFDLPRALLDTPLKPHAFTVWASIGAHDPFGAIAASAWQSGYFTLTRIAADEANAGVGQEHHVSTPVIVNAPRLPSVDPGTPPGIGTLPDPTNVSAVRIGLGPSPTALAAGSTLTVTLVDAAGAPVPPPSADVVVAVFLLRDVPAWNSTDPAANLDRAAWTGTAFGADLSATGGVATFTYPGLEDVSAEPAVVWAFVEDAASGERVSAYYSAARSAVASRGLGGEAFFAGAATPVFAN